MIRRFRCSSFCFCFAGSSLAQTPVRTKVFPGAQALPLIAGVQQGIFERHGIKLELLFTANSQELRDGLASGDFQVAHAAVDNAVAMVELAKHDVVIVTGGDTSMNEFFVQPDVRSFADLQGPHRDRRCAEHRLRAAGEEDPAHERPQGPLLHA